MVSLQGLSGRNDFCVGMETVVVGCGLVLPPFTASDCDLLKCATVTFFNDNWLVIVLSFMIVFLKCLPVRLTVEMDTPGLYNDSNNTKRCFAIPLFLTSFTKFHDCIM